MTPGHLSTTRASKPSTSRPERRSPPGNSLPAGDYGASVSGSPALASNGTIIDGTANGKPYGGSQPLYDESIVDLNPNTLALESAWQVPKSQQIGDGDFGASPTLFTATLSGVSTPMVGDCNKNGIYYAFRQDDLGAGPGMAATDHGPLSR